MKLVSLCSENKGDDQPSSTVTGIFVFAFANMINLLLFFFIVAALTGVCNGDSAMCYIL